MRDHELSHTDIAAIRVNTFREGACLFQGMPDDTSKAQYSLPFAVATMAAYGRIGVEHITGAGLSDPLVASIVDRISVFESERHSNRFPNSRFADVTITLPDGQVLDSGDVHARGGPEAPMDDAAVDEKFMEFATPSLGIDRAQAIRDAVWGLCTPRLQILGSDGSSVLRTANADDFRGSGFSLCLGAIQGIWTPAVNRPVMPICTQTFQFSAQEFSNVYKGANTREDLQKEVH